MTQDEVNELCGPRDDAARAMLKALKNAQSAWFQGNPATMQSIKDAIKLAEQAGITTGEKS